MSLGKKVIKLREKKGINQKELAEASKITQATISRIESGQVKQLKSEALKRLATALGVTVDYLIDKTKEITPDEILSSDPTAQYIFRGYEKLSSKGREDLKDYLDWIEQKEKMEEKKKKK
jgi:transcriptional regulator with XRE-family HTH domain